MVDQQLKLCALLLLLLAIALEQTVATGELLLPQQPQYVGRPPDLSPAYKVHLSVNETDPAKRWPSPHYNVFRMTSHTGVRYQCFTPSAAYDAAQMETLGASSAEEEAAPEPVGEGTKRLFGSCAKYRVRGDYWQYEVCHGNKVSQFHQQDPTAPRTQVNVLGVFLRNQQGPEDTREHVYEGGTDCELPDGTTKPRSTTVQLICSAAYKSATRQQLLAAHLAPTPKGHVADLEEPKPCHYHALFYTPLACSWEPGQHTKQVAAADRSANSLLKRLQKTCVHLLDGWWSYELCFGAHLRQFRMENTKIITDFSLGNSTHKRFKKAKDNVAVDPVSNKPYITHEYTNGTKCDLSGTPRSSSVRFVCGKSQSQIATLDMVKEIATCEYLAVVSSHLLCQHQQFQEKVRETRSVHCVPQKKHSV